MKYYLTKEWFYDILYPLTLGRGIKVCEEAGRAEEELYRQFYQKELESFMIKEKACLSPLDANDLPWVDRTLTRSGLAKESRQALKSLLWKEIEAKNKEGFEIDEEAIRRKFDNYLDNKLKICEQLPQEILKEIADIRVFGLGYMTQKVKDVLSAHLEEKDKENLHLVELSYREVERAEAALKKGIRFINYVGQTLSGIVKAGIDVEIKFIGLPTLVVRNANVIEWEGIVHKPKNYLEIPAKRKPPAVTKAEGVEVAKNGALYELHILMCNESSEGKRLAWNFTVSGTDIDSEGEYLIPPKF